MNILNEIVAHKKLEVELSKSKNKVSILTKSPLFDRKTLSLAEFLKNSDSGIIAEYKRKSPSKSEINMHSSVSDVVPFYKNAGAAGISVLTDEKFFGGKLEDLIFARSLVEIPLLRKDFIVDEYQIIEAKSAGADCILLIASILSKSEIQRFSALAKSLELEVLLEVHTQEELIQNKNSNIDLIGVNNRNLDTFQVDIQISKDLSKLIPNEFVKISESGISDVETIRELKKYGFQGFLMGENFMKSSNPGAAAIEFIKQLENEG